MFQKLDGLMDYLISEVKNQNLPTDEIKMQKLIYKIHNTSSKNITASNP